MKRIKYLIFTLILLLTPIMVRAASGSISVSGTSTAAVGSTVTVYVKISSSAGLGSWEMNLDYDKSYLKLTSATSESGGTAMAKSVTSAAKSYTYTFKFKALKSGTTRVSVDSYDAYQFSNFSEIKLSASSKTITIKTQEEIEASYSKNNDLASLNVSDFDLTPSFDKNVLEYSLEVPEDTKTIKINAKAADSKASISGAGEVEVSEGTNKFKVVVTAENGSEKTYTINVSVRDINPINVSVDGKDYTVVKVAGYLEKPNLFDEATITINDIEVPAFVNEAVNITLIGLKDNDGNIALYVYDEKTGKYTKYNEFTSDSTGIIILETDKKLKGYQLYTINYNDQEIKAYKTSEDSRYSIVYGKSLETGEEGFYMYDHKLKTFILFDEENLNNLVKQNDLFKYIIIGFAVILVVLIIIIVVKPKKKNIKTNNSAKSTSESKKKTDKKKSAEKKEKDENEIIEI